MKPYGVAFVFDSTKKCPSRFGNECLFLHTCCFLKKNVESECIGQKQTKSGCCDICDFRFFDTFFVFTQDQEFPHDYCLFIQFFNFCSVPKTDVDLWYCSLDHKNSQNVQKLSELAWRLKVYKSFFSEHLYVCAEGNRKLPSFRAASAEIARLELIQSDVNGRKEK